MRRDEAAKQEVLNRLAAIQAAAEILHDNEDMPDHQRHVFLEAISDETTRLSRLIQSCVGAVTAAAPYGEPMPSTPSACRASSE